jgi:hypothetical protein
MAEHDLMTAEYFKPDDEAPSTGGVATIQKSRPAQNSRVATAARASRWISVVAAVAVVACAAALVVPFLRTPSLRKATSPLDWLIRLCGVEPDKAVEKMLRDRGEANKREWDEKFRQSTTFQIDPSKPIDWHFEPQSNFK